jgi:hypothetical protein
MSLLNNTKDGYFGLLYHDDSDGGYVLADRGSRGLDASFASMQDYQNNFRNQFGYAAPEFNDAVLAAVELNDQLDEKTPLTFVGHSLGGGLAIDQTIATGRNAVVFDSEGVSAGTLDAAMEYTNRKLGQTLYEDYDSADIQSYEENSVTAYHAAGDIVTAGQNNRGAIAVIFDALANINPLLSTEDILKGALPDYLVKDMPPEELAKPPSQVADDIANGPPAPPGQMLPVTDGYPSHSFLELFEALQNQVIAREARGGG